MARRDAARDPDPDELGFLRALDAGGRVARTRDDLPGGSEQRTNAMRQRCSANGWARHGRDARATTGWLLTPAGARAIRRVDDAGAAEAGPRA